MTQNSDQFIQQFSSFNPSAKILVDLQHFGIIKVSGPDAEKFLQGQLTCDINDLELGSSKLGSYCNIKGKINSLFRIWRDADAYYLRMQNELIEPTITELKKYGIFSKIDIKNISEHFSGFGLYNHELDLANIAPELAVLTIAPKMRYEIYGPSNNLNTLWRDCILHSTQANSQIWDLLDIQVMIPELYIDTVDMFFPHDLNLPELGAVSFTKGCYRGQEIIARMQHRGTLKRHLHKFSTTAPTCYPSMKITMGNPTVNYLAGTVVRACPSTSDGYIGLMVLTDSMLDQDLYIDNHKISILT